MNGAIEEAEEEVVDDQEGQTITAIREALSESTIRVIQNDRDALFADIDSFVTLSQGNTSVTEVYFYPYDKKGDNTLSWETMGRGLANLKSLKHFIINFRENHGQETTAEEPTHWVDFRTLANVLPYLRQELVFEVSGVDHIALREEQVKGLARAIRRHPTIKEFKTCPKFPVDTFHIILSALATLPSLEAATLEIKNVYGRNFKKVHGMNFEHPEALKDLLPPYYPLFYLFFVSARPSNL